MIELYMKERGENMENKQKKSMISIFVIFIILVCLFEGLGNNIKTLVNNIEKTNSDNTFKIISSTENKDIEEIIQNYAKKNNIDVSFYVIIFLLWKILCVTIIQFDLLDDLCRKQKEIRKILENNILTPFLLTKDSQM